MIIFHSIFKSLGKIKIDVYAYGIFVFLILTKGEYPNISFADIANGKKKHQYHATSSNFQLNLSEIVDHLNQAIVNH